MTAMPNVRVRTAGPVDADIVLTMVREIAAHQNQSEHVTVDRDRWCELLNAPDVIVLIAENNRQPVGYVSALRRLHVWSGRDVLALDDLYVRNGFRSLGIGRMLMTELSGRVAPERLTITWGMEPDNLGAIRFYRSLGASLRPKVIASWPPSRQPE